MDLKKSMKVPLFFFGVADDMIAVDWLAKTKQQYVSDLFGSDLLSIPGFQRTVLC